MISALRPTEVHNLWEVLKPFIDKALAYASGEMDANDILDLIDKGSMLLIVAHEGLDIQTVITLEIITKPKMKICGITTCGGDRMDEWLDEVMDVINKLAKEQGCEQIHIAGRRGWTKQLKQYGYEHQYDIVSRTVI